MVAFCITRDSDPGLNKGRAKALYPVLVSYSDTSTRSTAQGYPYRAALADALDCTVDSIDNATKYLEREIGLIRVERRKVPGSSENDANEYQVYDQWLIHGCEPTPDTPPQLVARYGATIPGFDVAAWIAEHAPSFDLAGWRTAYEATIAAQEAKRAEQRRKAAKRRKAGSGTRSATSEGGETEGGSGTDSATGGGTDSATGSGMHAALSTPPLQELSSTADQAPSARSDGGVRSTETSGSGARGRSGSAASGKAGSSTGEGETSGVPVQRGSAGTELIDDEMAAIRVVEAGLPAILREQLPYKQFPKRNRPAVLEALESRTPEQLVARAARRWVERRYEVAFHDGEIRSPIAVALELLAPSRYCPDLSCDGDGTLVGGEEACKTCEKRIADRKAARRAGRPVLTGKPTKGLASRECNVCQRPVPGAPQDAAPEDVLCHGCRAELDRSVQHVTGPLAVEGNDRADQEAEDLQREADRRRAARAAAQTAPDAEDTDDQGREDTREAAPADRRYGPAPKAWEVARKQGWKKTEHQPYKQPAPGTVIDLGFF